MDPSPTVPLRKGRDLTSGTEFPESIANEELETQARGIANTLKADNIEISPDTEIVALIAYLQRLGKDIQVQKEASNQ